MATSEADRTHYWYLRLGENSTDLNESLKLQLLASILRNFCQLTEEELRLFTDPHFTSHTDDVNKTLLYSVAEQKVAKFYGGSFPDPGSKEALQEAGSRQRFRQEFRDILSTFYTEAELNELLSLATERDDCLLVQRLINDRHHFLIRRIRNAYLPAITDLLTIPLDGSGPVTSQSLIDTDEDPTDIIDRFLGSK